MTLVLVSESCHSYLVFQKFYIFILYWNTFEVSRAHLVKPIGVVLSLLPIDCLHYKKWQIGTIYLIQNKYCSEIYCYQKYFKLTFISFDILFLIKFYFFGNLQIISVLLWYFLRTKCQQDGAQASCSIRMLIKMSTRILIVNCWHQQVTLQCQCKQYIVFCRGKHFV